MTLETPEFIRRFLVHVLPKGLHRIRHYGLFANRARVENVERARQLLAAPPPPAKPAAEPSSLSYACPCCGGRMLIIETARVSPPYRPPNTTILLLPAKCAELNPSKISGSFCATTG
jgi:hypothetical protein